MRLPMAGRTERRLRVSGTAQRHVQYASAEDPCGQGVAIGVLGAAKSTMYVKVLRHETMNGIYLHRLKRSKRN
jgi:hypothetical protein